MRKIEYVPMGASIIQEFEFPNNTEILGVAVVDRIPHLLVLLGTGTSKSEITLGMYKTGQPIKLGILKYIGTVTLDNRQNLTFHIIIHNHES